MKFGINFSTWKPWQCTLLLAFLFLFINSCARYRVVTLTASFSTRAIIEFLNNAPAVAGH